MKVPTITTWVADFGMFVLPDDFPMAAMREDGWFDRRYKVYADMEAYIAEQSTKLETGAEKPMFRAPSFHDWRQAHAIAA